MPEKGEPFFLLILNRFKIPIFIHMSTAHLSIDQQMLSSLSIDMKLLAIIEHQYRIVYVKVRYINVREYRRDNKTGTIQRNWQHRVHKKNKNTTQHVLDTTLRKRCFHQIKQCSVLALINQCENTQTIILVLLWLQHANMDRLWEESSNSDGQQFCQYQQNKLHLTSSHWT